MKVIKLMKDLFFFFVLFLITLHSPLFSQALAQFSTLNEIEMGEDDLNSDEGDIFSDFDEDLESSQVLEDERFFRYGRFYSFAVSTGITSFTGNRGQAYHNNNLSYGLSLLYFMNFRVAFGVGLGYSQHNFAIDDKVAGYPYESGPGLIEVNMFRTFFSFRYYLDTYDLGTAVTYSNPYFIGRLEYWNQTKKFIEQIDVGNESSGALGSSIGVGLEFPIELKQSYVGFELLYHKVNFRDNYTTAYRPVEEGSKAGYNDMSGGVISGFASYVISW